MTRPIPQIAVRFVSEHEGCKLTAYQDSVGIWTIGYGHIGPEVVRGLSIPQSKALDYLRQDLGHAAFRLSQKVRGDVIDGLSDEQYAALLSFVFNLGAGDWTIWKRLNNREFDRVPMELMKFVNAGGRRIQGLVNRRAAEVVLWGQGDPETHDEAAPPSSVTRQVGMTPPTVTQKPLVKQNTFIAQTLTGVSIAGAAASQYSAPLKSAADQLAAFTGAPIIQHVTTILLTVAGLCVAAGIASAWLKHRAEKA